LALATVTVFGALGAVILVAFPIRYRLREKRQLAKARDRIAGDLHDEVGSNLGSIQMFADLAERRQGSSAELKRIQRIAAETVSAVRDIVWLLRPEGNHRIATVEHLRETCSIMLEPLEWKFSANEAAWQCEISDDANRHLFLFLRESLHNILRHSEAKHVEIHVECDAKEVRLKISDDGKGIAPEKLERPSTLRALRKRAESLDASLAVDSKPEQGTRLDLVIPLQRKRRAKSSKPSPDVAA
jgi:signal transduction histidine kinase